MELIEENNPRWNDLYYEFGGLDDYEDLEEETSQSHSLSSSEEEDDLPYGIYGFSSTDDDLEEEP